MPYFMNDVADAASATDKQFPITKDGGAQSPDATTAKPYQANGSLPRISRPPLRRNKKSQEKGIKHAMQFLYQAPAMTDVDTANESMYPTASFQPSAIRPTLKRNKKSQEKGIKHAMKFLYGWEDNGEELGKGNSQGTENVGKEEE